MEKLLYLPRQPIDDTCQDAQCAFTNIHNQACLCMYIFNAGCQVDSTTAFFASSHLRTLVQWPDLLLQTT
jgi:hypothetical protein